MARASSETLLSLERFARILGLNPLHFCSAQSTLLGASSECSDLWYQYQWQDPQGKVSREQIAELIAEAEEDLARELGYWPAPVWITDEAQSYPRPYRPELTGMGLDIRGHWKTVVLSKGYVQYGGLRATELLGTEDYVTLDADGDGFDEWAVFTVTVDADLNACDVHAYFKTFVALDAENCRTDPSSTGADPAWEVRDIQASVSGTTLTVRIHVWNLLQPQLQEGHSAVVIDANLAASFVDELVFYRVYADRSQQITFLWGDDAGCLDLACAWASQVGCMRVKDAAAATATLIPATWDEDEETWAASCWAQAMEPSAFLANYKAGFVPPRGLVGCEPLSDFWAKMITMLAASRIESPLCSCGNVQTLVDKWRDDKSMSSKTRAYHATAMTLMNPLGTRWGEEYVWKRVGRFMGEAAGR